MENGELRIKNEKFRLDELKSAVINRDLEKLVEFSKKEPIFNSIDEAKEILSYLNLAKKILEKEKENLQTEMTKIKNIKQYKSF